MKHDKTKAFFYGLILTAGWIPAAVNYTWALVMIPLWLTLWLSRWFAGSSVFSSLLFITLSSSLWSLVREYNGEWVFPVVVIVIAYLLWRTVLDKPQATVEQVSHFPSQKSAAAFLATALLTGILLHGSLNMILGKPVNMHAWNSVLLSSAVILFFYPALRQVQTVSWVAWLMPILMVSCAYAHYLQYSFLKHEVRNAFEFSRLAEKARMKGYRSLFIQLVVNETLRLSALGRQADGICYLRQQWQHAGRGRLAKAFRNAPAGQKNHFLFLSVFGAKLELQPGEKAVDFALQRDEDQLLTLTDKNRILQLSSNGIKEILLPSLAQRIASNQSGSLLSFTYSGHISLFVDQQQGAIISFPSAGKIVDVAASDDGKRVWVLDDDGVVHEAEHRDEVLGWQETGKKNQPFWEHEKLAQSFAQQEGEETVSFFVLDKSNGINLVSSNPQVRERWDLTDLYMNYNPERREAQDIVFWKNDELAVLDIFGAVHFFSPGLYRKIEEKEVSGQMKIPSHIHFNNDRGEWFREPKYVALQPYPETGTLLLLKEDGTIEVIAMPQGVRVFFRDRSGKIRTPELGVR